MEKSVFAEFSDSELEAFMMLHKEYNATISKYLNVDEMIKEYNNLVNKYNKLLEDKERRFRM